METPGVHERAQQAHDDLIKLGSLSVQFANVERLVRYPTGEVENDAEHSFHLAISAMEMAATYHPELDTGLVAQFCIVHDLAEVYTGDIPSYNLSAEDRAIKERDEKEAVEILLTELPPHIAQLLERYEQRVELEARFVRFIDKLMPAVIHAVAADQNREVFLGKYKITSPEELKTSSEKHSEQFKELFPEFDFVQIVRKLTSATSRAKMFPS